MDIIVEDTKNNVTGVKNGAIIKIPDELLDRLFPKPKEDQPKIIKNLEKLKKLTPDQYDILIDGIEFIAERIDNPKIIQEDKNKILNFFTNIKTSIKDLSKSIKE